MPEEASGTSLRPQLARKRVCKAIEWAPICSVISAVGVEISVWQELSTELNCKIKIYLCNHQWNLMSRAGKGVVTSARLCNAQTQKQKPIPALRLSPQTTFAEF